MGRKSYYSALVSPEPGSAQSSNQFAALADPSPESEEPEPTAEAVTEPELSETDFLPTELHIDTDNLSISIRSSSSSMGSSSTNSLGLDLTGLTKADLQDLMESIEEGCTSLTKNYAYTDVVNF